MFIDHCWHIHWHLKAAGLLLFCISAACRAASLPVETPNSPLVESSPPAARVEISPSPTIPPAPSPSPPAFTSTPEAIIPTIAPPAVQAPASPAPPAQAQIQSPTPGPTSTFPPIAQDTWCIPWNAPAVQVPVLRVLDGITIEVRLGGKIQQITYSGVAMLDYSQDWQVWERMLQANRRLVEGKTVTLIGGGPGSLEDDPILRYVLAENKFVNLEMIRSGYTAAQTTPPETSCDEVFRQAQQAAAAGLNGLWASTSTPTRTQRPASATPSQTGTLKIVKIFARGTPWQEPDEYVEIANLGSQPVQLAGWSIRDSENHAFIFPEFVLGAGQYCRVMTNDYQPEHCGFSYARPSAVWDNDSDCAYLQDSQGRLVDERCY